MLGIQATEDDRCTTAGAPARRRWAMPSVSPASRAGESGDTAATASLMAPGPTLTGDQVRDARAALESTGARRVVEARIRRLVHLSERRLAALPGEPTAVAALGTLVRTAAEPAAPHEEDTP